MTKVTAVPSTQPGHNQVFQNCSISERNRADGRQEGPDVHRILPPAHPAPLVEPAAGVSPRCMGVTPLGPLPQKRHNNKSHNTFSSKRPHFLSVALALLGGFTLCLPPAAIPRQPPDCPSQEPQDDVPIWPPATSCGPGDITFYPTLALCRS